MKDTYNRRDKVHCRYYDERYLQVVCVCVCFLPIHSGRQVRWTYQPGSRKEKEWTDFVQSDIRAFGITGDWETMAVKAEVWVEAVTKGGRRFMAAWRQEEEDAARHRQEKREATRLGKLQSHTEA